MRATTLFIIVFYHLMVPNTYAGENARHLTKAQATSLGFYFKITRDATDICGSNSTQVLVEPPKKIDDTELFGLFGGLFIEGGALFTAANSTRTKRYQDTFCIHPSVRDSFRLYAIYGTAEHGAKTYILHLFVGN